MSDAYSFAAMMEEAGLDLKIDAPGLGETLIKTLGANAAEIAEYKLSQDEELEDHELDLGCMVCPPSKSKIDC